MGHRAEGSGAASGISLMGASPYGVLGPLERLSAKVPK